MTRSELTCLGRVPIVITLITLKGKRKKTRYSLLLLSTSGQIDVVARLLNEIKNNNNNNNSGKNDDDDDDDKYDKFKDKHNILSH